MTREVGPILVTRPPSQTLLHLALLVSLVLIIGYTWKSKVITLTGPTKLTLLFSTSLFPLKLKGRATTIFCQMTIHKVSQHVWTSLPTCVPLLIKLT